VCAPVVCRTDLHLLDGELAGRLPVVLGSGHELLWEERAVRAAANLARADGAELLALARRVPVGTEVETFALEHPNEALGRHRAGGIPGSGGAHGLDARADGTEGP
jgi:D-arabinose 1-dehydrogenase-like Zn-dependent alcohol dehydrogenase